MKKLLLLLSLVFLLSVSTLAHPPQDLTADFDLDNNLLSVEVSHNAGGESSSHYVDSIVVTHNDNDLITQRINKQLTNTATYLYFMPAVEAGDSLEISASCNIAGEKSFDLVVEKNAEENE